MSIESPYGTQFISHLRSVSRRSYFDYDDLQAIKAMSREDLANTLSSKSPEFAQIVLDQTPEQAAELYHPRSEQLAAGRRDAAIGISSTATGLIDAISCLFSAAG